MKELTRISQAPQECQNPPSFILLQFYISEIKTIFFISISFWNRIVSSWIPFLFIKKKLCSIFYGPLFSHWNNKTLIYLHLRKKIMWGRASTFTQGSSIVKLWCSTQCAIESFKCMCLTACFGWRFVENLNLNFRLFFGEKRSLQLLNNSYRKQVLYLG